MSKPVYASASIEFDVQFYDVDSMRIVWHGHYVKYLERARCALLDQLGYNYLEMEASGYVWPIVDMRLKYVASACFADRIRVEAKLVEYQSRMVIDYVIRNVATGKVLTKATTIQVAVAIASGDMQFESPLQFRQQVERLS